MDPPRELVVRGLYRYVRNPMYLSVIVIVLRELLLTGSGALLAYWAVWFLAANVFVIGYEEPTPRRRFGGAYEQYSHTVGAMVTPIWGRADRALAARNAPLRAAERALAVNGPRVSGQRPPVRTDLGVGRRALLRQRPWHHA